MKTAIILLSLWAIVGPIWAVLLGRKNAHKADALASEANAAKTALANELAQLKAKYASGSVNSSTSADAKTSTVYTASTTTGTGSANTAS